MGIKLAAAVVLGIAAPLAGSIVTSAVARADVFIPCPSGRDGIATYAWRSRTGLCLLHRLRAAHRSAGAGERRRTK